MKDESLLTKHAKFLIKELDTTLKTLSKQEATPEIKQSIQRLAEGVNDEAK